MRHRRRTKKLSRSAAHRLALKRNIARSLFLSFGEREHIVTTKEKAKFVRPFAEKLITLARDKTLHNYRRGLKLLRDEDAVKKLFDEIGPRYKDRPGGYTRIVRTASLRLGDGGSQVLFGFVQEGAAGEAQPAGATESSAGSK
ncbi:MAG: 50S ribosomal protein L17 [Planctomycetes bacterium]|nr:50S ribosomal protein L17 [Planctomycetota bacterium]